MSAAARATATGAEPSMSRSHAAGAENARGLLLTVLGEFVLPAGERAWTSAFIEVLGRLGVEEKATRQALMRTAADGWLTTERVGRRTCWQLSGAAIQLLTEGTERIYGFTGSQQDWDGRWVLVLARAPESERAARHLLRTRLSWAGFGSPAPGIWVSTQPSRAREVEGVLAQAGVEADAQVFIAEHHGGGELTGMVAQAWDLETIEQRYQEFIAEFRTQPASDPLASLVALVHAWRRFPMIDPALPSELLPARWIGGRAAQQFQRQHAKWRNAASAEWSALTR